MAPRHCPAHAGLPRVWLGWGELGNRKAQLERTRKEYLTTHAPDFILLHPDSRRKSWGVHLDVIRQSTPWFDHRIDVTRNRQTMILPDLVRYEQIPSLLHFFYTGDYSVDEDDMSYYSAPPCNYGCVTCPQICQLLRVHLAMFQTALLLRITDLQALAFRRFRDLMDSAPIYVLRFAVHAVYSRRPIPDRTDFSITGLKSITDYRPELVLPAILRYCGYYRLNPARVRSRSRAPKERGEEEFADLRRRCPKFDAHMSKGLWLDMIDITVPTILFPGQSEPIRSLHPYLHASLPPRLVDPQRSNYQYVTYLQPLPFRPFSEQELTGSAAPPCASSGSSPSAPLEQGEPLTITEAINLTTEPDLTTEQSQDLNDDDRSLFGTPRETVETLPEVDDAAPVDTAPVDTAPVDTNEPDWRQSADWTGADLPDIDFSQLLDGSAQPAVLFDWPQPASSTELDLGNMDFTQLLDDGSADLPDGTSFDWMNPTDVDFTQFLKSDAFQTTDTLGVSDGTLFDYPMPAASTDEPTQLLTDDALDTLFTDSFCLDLPMDMNLDLSNQNSIDTAVQPDTDFTGLQPQSQYEPMDLSFLPATGASGFPQEVQFLPETHLTQPRASVIPQYNMHPRTFTPSTVSSAKARRDSRIRRSTVTSTRHASVSSYRTSAPASSSRYNLRNRSLKVRTADLEE
ncbi:uncharacterized protein N7515_001092 [Penicillium bovifimosum]|uniref:BTB domain-containing protein n=1 Tax=Penicillium bovifimosum TaxID=126998 RepID=A0A9W9LC49_9EURO|nr:uncharacterized protein N7515_001092 [Penicillium bovifimosum]KAJ5146528.1 hypothetical protein N7515_001092 [Penicillium bovifimosum]